LETRRLAVDVPPKKERMISRQAIGAIMTSAALRQALAEGCPLAILRSSEMGAGVYRGLGFEEHLKIGQFVWPGEH
jgi:hypothetical protein